MTNPTHPAPAVPAPPPGWRIERVDDRHIRVCDPSAAYNVILDLSDHALEMRVFWRLAVDLMEQAAAAAKPQAVPAPAEGDERAAFDEFRKRDLLEAPVHTSGEDKQWRAWRARAAWGLAHAYAEQARAEAYYRQAEKLLTSSEATLHAEIERLNAELKGRHQRQHDAEALAGEYLMQRDDARAALANVQPKEMGEAALLPEFEAISDDLIDQACEAGSILRVDLMRAWEVIREANEFGSVGLKLPNGEFIYPLDYGIPSLLTNQVWAFHQAAMAAQAPAPAHDRVPMPQNADQAAGMVLVGEAWLREHAPERLKSSTAPAPDHLELFKEAGEWAEAMKRKITPDMIELLGWLTGAANVWAETVEDRHAAPSPAVKAEPITDQEIRDNARTFANCNEYEKGQWVGSHFEADRLVMFARALLSRGEAQPPVQGSQP